MTRPPGEDSMRTESIFRTTFILVIAMALSGCASLQESMGDILQTEPGDGELDESKVTAGLREALRIGTG